MLERMAWRETDPKLKAELDRLAAAYRRLAELRAKQLNIPMPKHLPPQCEYAPGVTQHRANTQRAPP